MEVHDLKTKLEEVQAYFNKTGSAASLKNPDGNDGISLHFDIGIDPPSSCPSCFTLYGNWGGSSIIPKNEMPLPNPNPLNITLETRGTLTNGGMWDSFALVARGSQNQTINLYTDVGEYAGIVHGLGRFHSSRVGLFLYVITTPIGNSFFNPNQFLGSFGMKFRYGHSAYTMAHELGHYLGLAHYGQEEWGKFNCKPNYASIMNYAMPSNIGFSLWNSNFIDSPSLYEPTGTQLVCPGHPLSTDPSYLTNNTFQLTLFNPTCSFPFFPSVDWNHNGLEDTNTIRSPLLWNGCGELFHNQQNAILEEGRKPTQASLFRMDDRLYALSSTFSNGTLLQKHAHILKVSSGQGQYGSCQVNQDTTTSTSCLSWSSTSNVWDNASPSQATTSVRAFSSVWNYIPGWDNTTATIAYQIGSKIYVRQAKRQTGSHDLKFEQAAVEVVSSAFDADNASNAEIAGITLTWLRVNPFQFDGHLTVLALFYLDATTRKVRWKTKNSPTSSWIDRGDAAFEDPNSGTLFSLVSSFTPAMAHVPHPHTENGFTCGLFAKNRNSFSEVASLEVWCFERLIFATDFRWKRVASSVENSFRKPSLLFHTPRYTNGTEIDPSQGQFFAITTNSSWTNAANQWTFARQSETFTLYDLVHFELTKPLFSKHSIRYYYGSQTYRESVLFEDHETAAAKGLIMEQGSGANLADTTKIRFLPFADGTYRAETKVGSTSYFGFRNGNDFQVMEKFLCRSLLWTEKWPCEACQSHSDCPAGQFCQADQRCQ
jgi:hypothetical protein